VYPKEIELVIDTLPGVVESAVVGVPHPDFGESVTAVVVRQKNAAVDEAAVGDAFLISGEEPVSWKEMFERFARMLGEERRTVEMTEAEALVHWRESQRQRPRALGEAWRILKAEQRIRERIERTREVLWLRETASAVLPERWQQRIKGRLGRGGQPPAPKGELPIHPLSPELIAFFRARTRVRIDKAKRLLGYEPAFGFAAGMDLTERWAQWANLV